MATRTYRGVTIERVAHSGMYTAMVDVGEHYVPVKADTLDGMRGLIRDTLAKHGLARAGQAITRGAR